MSIFKMLGGLANSISSGIIAGQNRDLAQQLQQNQQGFQSEQNQLNRDFTASQNQLNRDFAAQQQLKNFQFAHYMNSNNAQMRMKDLQAAGINPMLASASNSFVSGGGSGSGTASSKSFEKKNDQITAGNQPSRGQKKEKITAKNVFVIR